MTKAAKPNYTIRVHFNEDEYLKMLVQEIKAYIMTNNWLDEKGRRYRDRIAKVEVNIIKKGNIDNLPIIIEVK